MVAKELQPTACWEFMGDILVLHHPTTISPKYQAMGKHTLLNLVLGHKQCFYHVVHCGSTRQTATIVSMNCEHLRTGDKATCRFRFIKNPEFLHSGARMVFREGRTKAVGNVTTIFPYIPGSSGFYKGKPSSKIAKAKVHSEKGGKKKRSKSKTTVTSSTSDYDKKTVNASSSDVNLTLSTS